MSNDLVLANARVVLADAMIERGWVAVVDGRIAEIGEARPPGPAEDLAGDLLIPGLVELHTDHIEAHYVPRPKVHWDPMAAVVSYDAQLATSGITTVLDSVRIWREAGIQEVDGQHDVLSDAIARACDADLLRADHFLHLRCEVPMPDIISDTEKMIGRREVRLMSLMDHTPGQRQFRDEAKLRVYYRGKKGGLTPQQMQMRTHYAKGLKAYRAQRWDEARTALAAALEAVPDDGPTLALTGRITDFKTNPPPENWDGAWHLDHK